MSLRSRISPRRRLVAAATRVAVEGGGIFVVISVAMIFLVLAANVWPLFMSATAEVRRTLSVPGAGDSLHYALNEYVDSGVRVTSEGEAIFFSLKDGSLWERQQLPGTDTARVVSHAATVPSHGGVALGLDNGRFVYAQIYFESGFEGSRQVSLPRLALPLGEEPLPLDRSGSALRHIAVAAADDDSIVVVAITADGRALRGDFTAEENPFAGTMEVQSELSGLGRVELEPRQLLLAGDASVMYVIGSTVMELYQLDGDGGMAMRQRVKSRNARGISAAGWMSGGDSLLVGYADGTVTQWFHADTEYDQSELVAVRSFDVHRDAVGALAFEHDRRTFAAISPGGGVSMHHATSEKDLWRGGSGSGARVDAAAFSPRGDALLLESGNSIDVYEVNNPHPEYSLRAVWDSIWYEGRAEPRHVWQSSSASSDFEPKFSLSPLLFGTIKASFYTMLFSVPVAILAACYSACFMSRRLRQKVKPTIEMLAAVPTVILGFVAGLWLAPLVEEHLSAVFMGMLLIPVAVVLLSLLWQARAAARFKERCAGWEPILLLLPALLLIPVVGWLGGVADSAWFGGQLSHWLVQHGIDHSQRNALVVGIIMGVAVMPIIYSISEDAMYEVPPSLVNGSLALGASRWQTMWRIVLLTASPALFSAIMIGLGRAVGETMIVVMATGNTPIMDLNIFEGFRAISANVAVEIPEAEKNSTHFRILFLATMLLFIITFVLNTAAELVRHHLRRRYSNL